MIPTIKVQADTPEGYILINESDFDSSQHQRYETRRPRSRTSAAAATEAEPDPPTSEQNSPPDSPRQAELEALYEADGYRAIQAIAEPLNIEKPKGGWRDAIPLIVEQEGASQ
jgi:hypothetical protein